MCTFKNLEEIWKTYEKKLKKRVTTLPSIRNLLASNFDQLYLKYYIELKKYVKSDL